MRIDRCEINPADDTVDPTLRFHVEIEFSPDFEIPLAVSGVIRSEDKKILGPLSIVKSADGKKNGPNSWNGPHGLEPRPDSSRQFKCHLVMDCPLSGRALAHLLSVREQNKKKDVLLTVDAEVRLLRPELEMAAITLQSVEFTPSNGFDEQQESKGIECLVYKYEQRRNRHSDRSGLNLVSAGSSGELAHIETSKLVAPKPFCIRSSDWVADFCPAFGVGDFIQVELPQPAPLSPDGPLAERLSEAVSALERMKNDVQQGEWEDCLVAARPIYELLNSREALESLLTDSGVPDEAAKPLMDSISGLFQFTSKFIHRVGKGRDGEVQTSPPANKEDALLVYCNAVTVVNMLGQKLRRQERASPMDPQP